MGNSKLLVFCFVVSKMRATVGRSLNSAIMMLLMPKYLFLVVYLSKLHFNTYTLVNEYHKQKKWKKNVKWNEKKENEEHQNTTLI